MSERLYTAHEVAALLDGVWQSVIAYPFPRVCKHLIASNLIGEMTELGFAVPEEIERAVCQADDETALAWRRPVADHY